MGAGGEGGGRCDGVDAGGETPAAVRSVEAVLTVVVVPVVATAAAMVGTPKGMSMPVLFFLAECLH